MSIGGHPIFPRWSKSQDPHMATAYHPWPWHAPGDDACITEGFSPAIIGKSWEVDIARESQRPKWLCLKMFGNVWENPQEPMVVHHSSPLFPRPSMTSAWRSRCLVPPCWALCWQRENSEPRRCSTGHSDWEVPGFQNLQFPFTRFHKYRLLQHVATMRLMEGPFELNPPKKIYRSVPQNSMVHHVSGNHPSNHQPNSTQFNLIQPNSTHQPP